MSGGSSSYAVEEKKEDVVVDKLKEVPDLEEQPTLLDPDGMGMEELLDNLEDEECKIEYIYRNKETVEEAMDQAYTANVEKKEGENWTLSTSLPEDCFGVVETALKPLLERASDLSPETLSQVICVYFKVLHDAQVKNKEERLIDFESSCASANDFSQMAVKMKQLALEISGQCNLTNNSSTSKERFDQFVDVVVELYNSDATHAAQTISRHVFKEILDAEDIMSVIFTEQWHEGGTDIAQQITNTIQEYMADARPYLGPTLFPKALEAMTTKYVLFYLQQLLGKTTEHDSQEDPYYSDNQAALDQLKADIVHARDFFLEMAQDQKELRFIEKQFGLLETIHRIVSIAAGKEGSAGVAIKALQSRIKRYETTFYIVGDLYHLVNPLEEKKIYEIIKGMAKDLKGMDDDNTMPPTALTTMLMNHLEQSKDQRDRPNLARKSINEWFGKLVQTSPRKSLGQTSSPLKSPTSTKPKLQLRRTSTSPQSKKKAYGELEKELLQVKMELDAANERAMKAEAQAMEVEDLRKDLAKANEKLVKIQQTKRAELRAKIAEAEAVEC